MKIGNSLSKIVKILNDNGISSPSFYKKEQGLNYRNYNATKNTWSASTLRKILTNQLYIGNMVQGYNKKTSYKSKKSKSIPKSNRIIIQHTHEPIITKEQFEKVQFMLSKKIKVCHSGELHPFSGKLFCLDCGAKLYKHQNEKGYVYFSCKNKCTSHSIGYQHLEVIVLQKIKEKILQYYDFNTLEGNFLSSNVTKITSLIQKQEKLNQQLEKILYAIKSTYLDKVQGIIDNALFLQLTNSLLKDKTLKEKELHCIIRQLEKMHSYKDNDSSLACKKEFIQKINNLSKLNYNLANSFINYIEVGEKMPLQKIVIHWKF